MATRRKTDQDRSRPVGRLGEVAYRRILDTIFGGRIKPGAFMSQAELVELLGVPVAPLRDALKLLESEGVVLVEPRSGIRFVKPDLPLIRSTYQFRTILERAGAAAYAQTADAGELDAIEARHLAFLERIRRDREAMPADEELEALEIGLHQPVMASLANPLIDATHKRLYTLVRLTRLDHKMTMPLVRTVLREHLDIIEALKARDPDRAALAMQDHMTASLQRGLRLFPGF